MDCDVVIVGGGPAGATAAYFLCGKGLKVIMVERMSDAGFERYHKICGAGVNADALKHIPLKDDEILNNVDTLRITWPQGNTINLNIKGYIIDRPKLFLRLRRESEEKGLKVIRGSVYDVLMMPDAVRTFLNDGTVISSKYVIGADGAYSAVRKSVFGTTPEIMLKVEEYHSDAKTEQNVLEFVVSEKYDHFYQWYFPYKDGRCTGAINGFAEDEPNSTRGIRTIPLGWVDPFVKKNVLLIGDAAGFPNCMTAGGLRTAVLSAEHAAEAILKDDLGRYEKWWKKNIMSDRRFMKVHDYIASCDDAKLSEFSKYMTHKGLWINGIHSVLHHPKLTWVYIGCLLSLRYGW
ncbi:MAG: NAD(P)/FAD-dependent oxidoreductase [archaeon]|nr:NAD(P)/FAD-dependent oxidoreductase [archaeon]